MRLLRSMEAPRAIYLAAAFSIASLGLASTANAALVVSTNATKNVSCSAGVCTATALHAVLNVGSLQTLLASGSVKLVSGSVAGDIDVIASLTWASNNGLTLDAYHSIEISQPVAVSGSGPLTLTNNDGGSNGALGFQAKGRVAFLSTSNALTINGNAYTLFDSVSQLVSDYAADTSNYYALANNYDAKPDGTYSHSPINEFDANMEGLGNSISRLSIMGTNANGLFSTNDGIIQDLSLLNVAIRGGSPSEVVASYVGALAGTNYVGNIINCSVTGRVHGEKNSTVGGLVGFNNEGQIISSHSSAEVQGWDAAGGLVGGNGGAISYSSATGKVTSLAHRGAGTYAGGLVGMSGGAIDSSFATGAVSGETAGGLAGLSGHPITHSYATGAVSAALYGGGLLGVNEATQALNVSQVYSTGSVAQTGTFGGLIGQDQVHSGNISDAYWDETTSGVTNSSQGAGTPANDPGIAGLSNTQLTSALPTGFDPAIWAQSPSINNGLPYLIANPPR